MKTHTRPDSHNTIFVEQATVVQQQRYADKQYILRLAMPRTAATAYAGQFIHIQCSRMLPLRRPYSILNVAPEAGWVEILYRAIGTGGKLLAQVEAGMVLNCMGPIGNGFALHKKHPKPLLLGGGVGVPPVLLLANQIAQNISQWEPFVLLASERPFPFPICTSGKELPCTSATATLTQLEKQGIQARLCSHQPHDDFFIGRIDELAAAYLNSLDDNSLAQTEIFACGPEKMLITIAQLSKKYKIPCQICVEEYMACGIGGCAGCTIKLMENGTSSMRRVCVDGPVFPAEAVVSA